VPRRLDLGARPHEIGLERLFTRVPVPQDGVERQPSEIEPPHRDTRLLEPASVRLRQCVTEAPRTRVPKDQERLFHATKKAPLGP